MEQNSKASKVPLIDVLNQLTWSCRQIFWDLLDSCGLISFSNWLTEILNHKLEDGNCLVFKRLSSNCLDAVWTLKISESFLKSTIIDSLSMFISMFNEHCSSICKTHRRVIPQAPRCKPSNISHLRLSCGNLCGILASINRRFIKW